MYFPLKKCSVSVSLECSLHIPDLKLRKLNHYFFYYHFNISFDRTYVYDFEHMIVTLGAHNRVKSESTQVRRNVKSIKSHTSHVYYQKNDIAILELSEPVTYTNYIQPICLPSELEDLPIYSTCYTVGWGHTSWNGK